MKTYRVRFHIYKFDGETAEEVKESVCEIMRAMPEKFVSVEPFEVHTPLWRLFLRGR